MFALNKVLLTGAVSEAGPKLNYPESGGNPVCSFTLIVTEKGPNGQAFKLFVPVDVFGKDAENTAERLEAGMPVFIDGKLKWKSWVDKKGEKQGRLTVMTWSVQVGEEPVASGSPRQLSMDDTDVPF
ncbi:MAG: single-stranded DNA-binding protein [Candidatus Tectomicrobia bacterium]|nr:single-stranded DNA-binding protein [Candidatus Tectomicrobia bacterium]